MAISITHKKVSSVPDSADTTLVRPSDWNDTHDATGIAASGANSDITSLSGITGGISTPQYIQMDDGTGQALVAGKMWYTPATGAWNLGMGNGNITQQVGEEIFVYGKASSAITEGQVIVKTGAVGASGVITFAPAGAGITDDQAIIGIATENIALNGFGRVTAFGVVHGINTSAFSDGDTVWYDPATGGLTATKPTAPNVKCQMGIVINAGSGGSGSIQVEIIHGTSLGGTDSNVNISSPTGGNLLSYDQTAGYWKNINLTDGTGITVTEASNGSITIASTVEGLPSQTGNSGKYLTTNGTAASWNTLPTYLPVTNRAGSSVQVSTAYGYLPVTTYGGSTTNVPIY